MIRKSAIVCFFALLLVFVQVNGQTPQWKWVKSGGGSGTDEALDVLTDSLNNLYACGIYTNSATFDGQTIAAAGVNSFLIKYDSVGNLLWALSYPGKLKKLTIDPLNNNNLIASGTFSNTISIGNTTLISNGGVDCFAFKFNSQGTVEWVSSWGGNNDDDVNDIEFQLGSDIISTGTFNSNVIFFPDGISLNYVYDTSLTNNGRAQNLYAVRLRSSNGKALAAFKQGVSGNLGQIYILPIELIFDADMRGNIGLSMYNGYKYGGDTIKYPYAILQLNSDLSLHRRVFVDSNFIGNDFQLILTKTYSHLDRNGIYFIHSSKNYRDIGGIFVGDDWHEEHVKTYNIFKQNFTITDDAGIHYEDLARLRHFTKYGNRNTSRQTIFTYPIDSFRIKAANSFKSHVAKLQSANHFINESENRLFMAGKYTGIRDTLDNIIISNAGGIDAYFSVLKLPELPLIADAGIDRIKCSGNTNGVYIGGYPVASGGNNNQYSYSWSPSTGLNDPSVSYPLANPSTTTTYYLTVTNNAGQIARDTVIVYVNQSVPASITPAGTITVCGSETVRLTASLGVYYLWSTGDTTRTIGNFLPLPAGTYTVSIKDECGNVSVSPPVTIIRNPAPPTPTITASGPTTFCNGGTVTLSAPSGYSYLWSTGATTQSILVNTSGNYSVTVFNNFGCSNTSFSQYVTVRPRTTDNLSITVGNNQSTSFCQGGSVNLIGPQGFTYLWSTGSTLPQINVNATGTYGLTISSPYGCGTPQALSPVAINVLPSPPIPVISTSGPTIFCNPGQVTLTGPPGYQYIWKNANGDTLSTSQSIIADSTGYYRLIVKLGNGCENFNAINIYENSPMSVPPVITVQGQTTVCSNAGTFPTLSVPYSPSRTYLWNTGATTAAINANTSGNYTVTVSNGCNSLTSAPVPVVINQPAPDVINASGPLTFCAGGSVTLTAAAGAGYVYQWRYFSTPIATTQSIVVTASGSYTVYITTPENCVTSRGVTVTVHALPATPSINASGPTSFCQGGSVNLYPSPVSPSNSYLWSNGASTPIINVTSGGNYIVTATNANGCSSTSPPFTITVNPLPTATITASGPTTICQGGSVTLSAPGGFSYLWSNGATSQSINVNTSGNYTVTVTNANGCSSTSVAQTVTVNPLPPIPVITPSGVTTFCQGGSVTLSAPAGYTYLWSNGATSQSINVTTGGNYSVMITNANGCSSSSAATTVTVNALPTVPVITTSGSTSFCQGGSVTLTAPAGYSYLWNTGATTQSINVNTTGSYTVTVTNGNGCTNISVPVNVTVNPLPPVPVITAGGPTTFCQGSSVSLSAPAGYTYLWTNGATSQSINVTTGGNYSVMITNANGCSSSSAATTVTVNALPTVPVITTSGSTSLCQGGSVTLTAPAGFTYLWSTGATSQSITVNTSGNYSVTVTNNNNCSSTSLPVAVTVHPLPPVPVITQNGNVLTSTPATTYQWYFNGSLIPGATAQSYTYTTGGDYTVTVTNAQGCSATSVIYTAMRNAIVTLDNNERFYFSLFPNPVTTNLTINYTIEQSHRVGIRLINTQGRTITIQSPVTRSAGSYTVNANAVVERIWTGVYFLEFTVDGKKVSRTILKL